MPAPSPRVRGVKEPVTERVAGAAGKRRADRSLSVERGSLEGERGLPGERQLAVAVAAQLASKSPRGAKSPRVSN